MYRMTFRRDLDRLFGRVAQFGGEVESEMAAMASVVLGRDFEEAGRWVGSDRRFKSWGIEIEDDCMRLQTLQAPVAGDLRLIRAVGVVSERIVRSATLCEHVFRAFSEMQRFGGLEFEDAVEEMVVKGHGIFAFGLDVFVSRRTDCVVELTRRNAEITALRAKVMEIACGEDGSRCSSGHLARAVLISHYLERISDHSTDIGLHTVPVAAYRHSA